MSASSDGKERWVRGIVLITKKEGMSQEDFDKHWLEVHGAIAAKYPNVVRYSQLHLKGQGTVGEIETDSTARVDGIVDFIYTSAEGYAKIWESPIGLEGLEDCRKFLGTITEYYVEETVIIDHLGLGALTDRELVSEPPRFE